MADIQAHGTRVMLAEFRQEKTRSATQVQNARGPRGNLADHLSMPVLLKEAAELKRIAIGVAGRELLVELDLRLGIGAGGL